MPRSVSRCLPCQTPYIRIVAQRRPQRHLDLPSSQGEGGSPPPSRQPGGLRDHAGDVLSCGGPHECVRVLARQGQGNVLKVVSRPHVKTGPQRIHAASLEARATKLRSSCIQHAHKVAVVVVNEGKETDTIRLQRIADSTLLNLIPMGKRYQRQHALPGHYQGGSHHLCRRSLPKPKGAWRSPQFAKGGSCLCIEFVWRERLVIQRRARLDRGMGSAASGSMSGGWQPHSMAAASPRGEMWGHRHCPAVHYKGK